jgi:transposase
VRPYVPRNKTDRADAKGLLEAHRNKEIKPVPVKSVDQQAIASLHRLRAGWMATRTARLNVLRGILREFGIVIPVGAQKVIPAVTALLGDGAIPQIIAPSVTAVCEEIMAIQLRIKTLERQLTAIGQQTPPIRRFLTIPGVGLLSATALFAIVGDMRRFPSGRHFASFLGITPHEWSSGLRRVLGRISKRGDTYLRSLLIQGARAVLAAAKKKASCDRLSAWALEVEKRRGHNKAVVALANKMARRAWAISTRDTDYVDEPCALRLQA